MSKKKAFTIKIKRDELPKRRAGVKASKIEKSKKVYRRKTKHANKAE